MTRDDLDVLERWCDGMLDDAALAAWTARLAADPALAAEVATELRLVNSMRLLREPAARHAAAAQVAASRTRALLDADRDSRRERTVSAVMAEARRSSWRRWWSVGAAAAALAVVAWWWWPNTGTVAWGDGHALVAGAVVPADVREVRFADGSTVTLVPDSRVRLGGDGTHKDLRLDAGALTASVAHQSSNGSFAVTTAQGTARVRGTRFDLAIAGDSTLLSVSDGTVSLQAENITIHVGAGGRALAADGRSIALPPQWRDRRPLGRLVLSGANGFPTNANGWLFDARLDQRSPAFAERLSARIDQAIAALRGIDAQGLLLYAIEGGGAQAHAGFVGDPRRLQDLAPEFDAIADALFARIQAAGLVSGITITPWRLTRQGDRWIQVADAAGAESELDAKIAYAKQRWGCRVFYLNVASPGLPADIAVPPTSLRGVVARHPDVLLIVEHADRAHAAAAGVQVLGREPAHAGDLVIRLPWLGAKPMPTDLIDARRRGEVLMLDPLSEEQLGALQRLPRFP